jgi:hypothetical protein
VQACLVARRTDEPPAGVQILTVASLDEVVDAPDRGCGLPVVDASLR